MNRIDVINELIERNGYTTYLEIGVHKGECFEAVRARVKACVDPCSEFPATHKMTSDEFFATNTERYDIVFIDGLHEKYQVLRDVEHALQRLNDGGTIVLHDCSPPDARAAQRDDYGGVWCGTVYQAAILLKARPDIHVRVLDCDLGVGIVTPVGFEEFSRNREALIGLVPEDEL